MDLKAMLGKKKQLGSEEKDAKLKALEHMKGIASDMMKDGLKGGLSKVTVAADSPDHLKKGLDKAKELLGKPEEEESPEEESSESPMEEAKEMASGEEECSPEEIDAMIKKLEDLKKTMK